MKSSTALDLIGEQHDVQGGSLNIHHVCLVKYRKHDAPQPVWGISWYVLMMQSHQLCLTVCACCTYRCMMLGNGSIDHHNSTCQHSLLQAAQATTQLSHQTKQQHIAADLRHTGGFTNCVCTLHKATAVAQAKSCMQWVLQLHSQSPSDSLWACLLVIAGDSS